MLTSPPRQALFSTATRSPATAYAIALSAVVVALLVRLGTTYWFQEDVPFLVAIVAVLISAWYGGWWPGTLATVLTGAMSALIVLAPGSLDIGSVGAQLRLTLFGVVGLFVSLVSERYHRAHRRLDQELMRRKEHERRNEQLYGQLRLMTDRAPVLLSHCDGDHRYKFVNLPYAERFGLAPDDLIGRSIEEVIGDEAFAVIKPYGDAALAGRRVEFEAEIPYRDIGVHSMRIAYEPEFDDGRVVGYVAAIVDVSERRGMEQRLRASEHQFRQLADAMPQIAWVTNSEGRLMYVNRRWQDYTGLTLEQSQPDALLPSVVHPEDANGMTQAWRQSLASGKDYDFQMRFKRVGDGAFRWFLCRGVAVKDERGRILQWFSTATDIEDQKRAEEALREADRRKDEFLAMLAHELRNPLAPIRHGLHLLELAGHDNAVREQARGVMERQTAQMVRLIDDLLDVARISRNTLELRKEWIELTAVVQSAVEACTPLIEAAGHTLTVSVPPTKVLLNADLTRLAQVLSNLLNNAVKYTRVSGRIALTAACRDGAVIISVRDNGIGIPRETLPTIFGMFVQADRSLEAARGGLGIGLTLAKRLIEMHGGSIEAHSDGPGSGSEFVVRLPMVMIHSDVTRPKAITAQRAPAAALSVLVVDDNQDAADSLSAVLRLAGHATRTAHDGVRALEVAETFRPDAVLLDIGMPRLNGYVVAERLRASAWSRSALLVALTGWGQDADKKRAVQAGFDHHLIKPVNVDELLMLLARYADAAATRGSRFSV